MILWEFDLKNNIQSSDILLIKIFKGGGGVIWFEIVKIVKKKSYQDFFFSMIWNMWSETFVIYNALITFIGSFAGNPLKWGNLIGTNFNEAVNAIDFVVAIPLCQVIEVKLFEKL